MVIVSAMPGTGYPCSGARVVDTGLDSTTQFWSFQPPASCFKPVFPVQPVMGQFSHHSLLVSMTCPRHSAVTAATEPPGKLLTLLCWPLMRSFR